MYGQITNYFKDAANALICTDFERAAFAEKMKQALSDRESLEKLAIESYKTGLENFDYKVLGKKLYHFLTSY